MLAERLRVKPQNDYATNPLFAGAGHTPRQFIDRWKIPSTDYDSSLTVAAPTL